MKYNMFIVAAALMSAHLASPVFAQEAEDPAVATDADEGVSFDPIDDALVNLTTYPSLLAHPYEVTLTGLIPDSEVRCQLRDASDAVLATETQISRTADIRILFKEKTPDLTATCSYVQTTTSIRPSTGAVVRRFGS